MKSKTVPNTTMIRQTQFTMGEVDERNFKRTDFQDYMTAAQSLLNMETSTTGLAKKRRGTRFAGDVTAYAVDNSQIYGLVDKDGTQWILLSANLVMHIFKVVAGVATWYTDITTLYPSALLNTLDYAINGDSIVFVQHQFPPARIHIASYSPVVWAGNPPIFYPPPSYDFQIINYNAGTVSASVSSGVLTLTMTGVLGFTSAWVNGVIIGLGSSVTSPLGSAIITAVSAYTGTSVTFTATVTNPFAANAALPTIGAQWSIRQPVISTALGYFSAVLFYQNRLWFANTAALPNTIFGSKINSPTNFDVGNGSDADAIIYTIGQNDSGGILWLNGGKQLEIYCQNEEFAAPQEQNIGLTPGTFSIRQQSSYGASFDMKPLTYINDSYYVTQSGNAFTNFHFDGIGQTYTSANISVAAEHLIKNPINRAIQRGTSASQDNFIYLVNADFTITSFQFAKESKLAALTPFQFINEWVYDITTAANTIYILKKIIHTGNFTIETFDDTVFLDSYVIANMDADGLITGTDLIVLEGNGVQIVYNDQDYGVSLDASGNQAPVTGGQCYAYNPNGVSGEVKVGLLYPCRITPMYLFAGSSQSAYFKQITNIFVDYYKSLDFYVNGVLVNYQTFADVQAGAPLAPRTGTAVVPSVDGWNRFATFDITQNSPFDLQILGISYQIAAAII